MGLAICLTTSCKVSGAREDVPPFKVLYFKLRIQLYSYPKLNTEVSGDPYIRILQSSYLEHSHSRLSGKQESESCMYLVSFCALRVVVIKRGCELTW